MFSRCEDDDVINEMKRAIEADLVFGVGFNIPQPLGREVLPYHGSFVPEVRCGFFDVLRMKNQAPYPNLISEDGRLEKSWYRSIEDYQNQTGWRCLRGGRSTSVYVHPMNSMKSDVPFHDRVLDLIEQNLIPKEQLGHWDVVEDRTAWRYPPPRRSRVCTALLPAHRALHSGAYSEYQRPRRGALWSCNFLR